MANNQSCDPRLAQPDALRLPQRRARRRCGGRRRHRLRPGRVEISPFPASTTNACCICGRASGISCAACSMPKSRPPRSDCKCSAWGRIARLGSTSAAIAINARRQLRRAARVAYEPRLRRALERNFPGWTVGRLTTSMDLQRSFGPAYLRGSLRHGQRSLAIVGVNDQETQSTVDGALTIGILGLRPAGWPSRNAAWSKGWR